VTTEGRIKQRSPSKLILRIHVRTGSDEKVSEFLVTGLNRMMQRSPSTTILRIHIRTGSNGLLGGFNVSVYGSLSQRTIWVSTPNQNHGCDCCE